MISQGADFGDAGHRTAREMRRATDRLGCTPSQSVPSTTDTRCCTQAYGSSPQSCVTRTLPGRQARERSLRRRSTIITFSARSLGETVSSLANRAIGFRVARAGRGAFDRPRFDVPVGDFEESFGRGAGNLPAAAVEVAGHRRGIPLTETTVEIDWRSHARGGADVAQGSPGRRRRRRYIRSRGERREGIRRRRTCW